ncbi:MAG: hypothetical protein Q9220_000476 [cf. Caloplaca sp. 1 TL-2023]
MPSRSNPNVPSKSKRKAASVLKSKRKNTQRLVNNKITKKAVPRTSQAIRQAAPLSGKRARKVMKKGGYAQQRKEAEEYLGADVDMKDLDAKAGRKVKNAEVEKENVQMDVD